MSSKTSCCMNILNQFHDGEDGLPIRQAPVHPAFPPLTERQFFANDDAAFTLLKERNRNMVLTKKWD